MKMKWIAAVLLAAIGLSGCVEGTDYVSRNAARPFQEGLYESCDVRGLACKPLYLFRNSDEYIFASRSGLQGAIKVSEIGDGEYMAYGRLGSNSRAAYGYIRRTEDGGFDAYQFDCKEIARNFDTKALTAGGMFSLNNRGSLRCRIRGNRQYAALVDFVRKNYKTMARIDRIFKLRLKRTHDEVEGDAKL